MRRGFPGVPFAMLALACRAPPPPPSVQPDPGAPSASTISTGVPSHGNPKTAPGEPQRFEVKEGVAVDIGNGVTLTLKDTFEAHLAGSKNKARARLVVTHGSQSVEVTLDRVYPGPPRWKKQLGVELAIDFVDAYHQPATGAILVRFE